MKKEQLIKQVQIKYDLLKNVFNEYTRRLWLWTEAIAIWRWWQTIVVKATGVNKNTVLAWVKEIRANKLNLNNWWICKKWWWRKKLTEINKDLIKDLKNIIDSSTRWDPESPLLWCSKSLRKIADELGKTYKISHNTVWNILKNIWYSLQWNRKTQEWGEHKDRDEQFKFINKKTQDFQSEKEPVISVDTKKKENIGNFKNEWKEYYKKWSSPEVNVYDFIDKEKWKVNPYWVYDIEQNKWWVSVWISSDTAKFAVNSIRSWWYKMWKKTYKWATKIYINADWWWSNGSRVRMWKTELQKFANEINMEIHISHFPPWTSKWNKIEHRMFSFISKNWRWKPLLDRATVVKLIWNTTTKTWLKIEAELDENIYEKWIKISDEEFSKVNIKKNDFHGEWNYIILPNNS